MEPIDNFDSLLKAAAGEYNKTPLTENDLNNMIDAQLIASKKKLDFQFKKEINIILACMVLLIVSECFNLRRTNIQVPVLVTSMHIINIVGIVYMLISFFMFKQLQQASAAQKDTHIRNYIRSIYEKTQRVLRIYLWASTTAGVFMIALQFTFYPRLSWYWAAIIGLVLSVALYYTNVWYIRKRFGKGIREMKDLLAEFE